MSAIMRICRQTGRRTVRALACPLPTPVSPPARIPAPILGTWLTLPLRLGLAILTASLALGCSSAPVSETTGHPVSTRTLHAETKVPSRFQAVSKVETTTTTSPFSAATLSSTPAATATPTLSPPATSTPAHTPDNIPGTETPVHAGQEATDADLPPHARAHGAGFKASGEAAAAPVDGRPDSFDPGPRARGDGDDQARPIPDKGELKYPKLGSQLNGLVASVEAGRATAEEAAADTPVHSGESVAVTIHLSGNVDGVVAFLKENGGDPRNVGEDYIEAYVPVALLGPVSERTGVLRVRAIIPPQADRTSSAVAPVTTLRSVTPDRSVPVLKKDAPSSPEMVPCPDMSKAFESTCEAPPSG